MHWSIGPFIHSSVSSLSRPKKHDWPCIPRVYHVYTTCYTTVKRLLWKSIESNERGECWVDDPWFGAGIRRRFFSATPRRRARGWCWSEWRARDGPWERVIGWDAEETVTCAATSEATRKTLSRRPCVWKEWRSEVRRRMCSTFLNSVYDILHTCIWCKSFSKFGLTRETVILIFFCAGRPLPKLQQRVCS